MFSHVTISPLSSSLLLVVLLSSTFWGLTSELLVRIPPTRLEPGLRPRLSSSSPSPLRFDKTTTLAHLQYAELSACPEPTVRNWTCANWCTAPAVRPTEIHFVENLEQGTRGLVAFVPPLHLLIVSFRGSQNVKNWIANLEFRKTTLHFGRPPAGVYVHTGFQAAYETLRNETLTIATSILTSQCQKVSCRLLAVGHSLGGALATLAAVDLAAVAMSQLAPPIMLTTFGSPRVGNAAFAAWAMNVIGYETSTRLVNKYDVVPSLPPMSFGFHHLATEVWEMRNSTTTTTTTEEAFPTSSPPPSPSPSPSPSPPPPPPVVEDSYVICDSSGEDPTCATYRADSIDDHVHYMQQNLGYC